MFYATLVEYKPDVFKRLTGVSPDTFALMLCVLEAARCTRGRKPKLCVADQLLMALMYWREYRSLAHIGGTYGVSEATVSRTVRQIEHALLADARFHLPGKKALYTSEIVYNVVLLDATECPCERPKKNNVGTTVARRSATRKKRS